MTATHMLRFESQSSEEYLKLAPDAALRQMSSKNAACDMDVVSLAEITEFDK